MEIRVLAPKPAVRAMCADCLGMTQWNRKEVEACQGDEALAGPCTLSLTGWGEEYRSNTSARMFTLPKRADFPCPRV